MELKGVIAGNNRNRCTSVCRVKSNGTVFDPRAICKVNLIDSRKSQQRDERRPMRGDSAVWKFRIITVKEIFKK